MPKAHVIRRKTKQRETILRVLRRTQSHPTADWIYEQVRLEIPNISLGTVYRNLNLLKEEGEILELDYGSTYSRFDGNPKPHYHFACYGCGRVFDFDYPVLQNLNEDASRTTGFKVLEHRLEFYGYCPECQRQKSENDKS